MNTTFKETIYNLKTNNFPCSGIYVNTLFSILVNPDQIASKINHGESCLYYHLLK